MHACLIGQADAVKKDDLKEIREQLHARTGDAGGAVTGKMDAMMSTLDASIDKLTEDLNAMLSGLGQGDYIDPAMDPKAVLEKLNNVQEQVTMLTETGAQLSDERNDTKLQLDASLREAEGLRGECAAAEASLQRVWWQPRRARRCSSP